MSAERLTLYRTESTDPYRNLALEEALLGRVREGEVILYLWRNEDTIVIGRNQDAWRECRAAEFTAAGGRIARRLSGGGAVYHDLQNLNYTFFGAGAAYDRDRFTRIILRAVGALGVEAGKTGRNDLTAEGKKFSGSAYCMKGRAGFQHGTLLIRPGEKGLSYLTPDREKLAKRSVPSVRARVAGLADHIPGLTPEKTAEAVLSAFSEEYGLPVREEREDISLSEEVRKGREKFASPAWIFGEKKGWTREVRLPSEEGVMTAYLSVRDGIVEDALVRTDAMDPDAAEKRRLLLIGRPVSELTEENN